MAAIRESLVALLSGKYTESHVSEVVRFSRVIAQTAVNGKISPLSANRGFIGLPVEDIAFDCIADLFQRRDGNDFVQLKTYFGGLSFPHISDEELTIHFRRLIFSKVNDGLFRIYNEVDPTLGRIIRNIRLAVRSLHNFDEIERLGQNCLCPVMVRRLEELPSLDIEALEVGLRTHTSNRMETPNLLSALSLFLREQTDYCRIVPLVSVAVVFRSVYMGAFGDAYVMRTPEDELLITDVRATITEVCNEVKAEFGPRYIFKRKKVSEDLFGTYIQAIEESLVRKFIGDDGHSDSLFEHLRTKFPNMGRRSYAADHKKLVEYLLRIANDRALRKLSRIISERE